MLVDYCSLLIDQITSAETAQHIDFFVFLHYNLNILTFWVMIMMMMTTMMMMTMTMMIIMMVRWGAACATEQLLEPLTGATSFLKIHINQNFYIIKYNLDNILIFLAS